jgi:FtsH-binding integral membrane protein
MDGERNFEVGGRRVDSTYGRSGVLAQGFMQKVYLWMTMGLAATAIVSFFTSTSQDLMMFLFVTHGMVPFGILVVAEIGIVMFLSFRVMKMNPVTASMLFFLYAALNGITIAPVLVSYTGASVATTFFVTAGMFGGMSAYGMVTKRDLTGFGSFLTMGLFGLLIAILVNLFLRNNMMSYVISGMAIIIFTGLAAYDTNKLRAIGESVGDTERDNLAVLGALTLYLDFINLCMHLLRFMGKRD